MLPCGDLAAFQKGFGDARLAENPRLQDCLLGRPCGCPEGSAPEGGFFGSEAGEARAVFFLAFIRNQGKAYIFRPWRAARGSLDKLWLAFAAGAWDSSSSEAPAPKTASFSQRGAPQGKTQENTA